MGPWHGPPEWANVLSHMKQCSFKRVYMEEHTRGAVSQLLPLGRTHRGTPDLLRTRQGALLPLGRTRRGFTRKNTRGHTRFARLNPMKIGTGRVPVAPRLIPNAGKAKAKPKAPCLVPNAVKARP